MNVVANYNFPLEVFAQRLTFLLPQNVSKSPGVLIQCSALYDRYHPWYKFAGEAVLTEVMKKDIRGTELAKDYFEIEESMDLVRSREFHARKVIEDFPEAFKLSP